jgi:hypothetical protein
MNTKGRMFSDYDGPTGPFIATTDGMRPITDPQALAALADAAMLTSLGATDRAAEFQRRLEAGRRRAASTANEIGRPGPFKARTEM